LSFLVASPLLTLFVVAAAGYLIGKVRVAGFGLGVAAVLFCGLALGALDQRVALPEFVPLFGLVLFVYTIGLASGPGFFASLRRRGLRDNGVALTAIVTGAVVAVMVGTLLGLDAGRIAGLFAGGLTNTPALAAVVEQLAGADETVRSAPIVAYSITYPLGVLGPLFAVLLARRVAARGTSAGDDQAAANVLQNLTVRVTRAEACAGTGKAVLDRHQLRVAIGRMRRGGELRIFDDNDEALRLDDVIVLVGPRDELERAAALLGEIISDQVELDLAMDRRVLDFRRIVVSSPDCAGRSLGALDLHTRFAATATRVRRGDVELLASDDLILELGDRVRVVAPRQRLAEISHFFGDSYRALAEVDVVSIGLGICLGLLLGSLPVPLPGGGHFTLGYAGGPLIVGLLLGRLGRTGPLVWNLPFSANLTLRQLGLVLFLAGVGTRSGHAFATTLQDGHALPLLLTGAAITLSAALVAIALGRILGLSRDRLTGVIAGAHTQPAVLAFAVEKAGSDLPNAGYASVFPLATIVKILAAQMIAQFMG
jgi:putative transport protein